MVSIKSYEDGNLTYGSGKNISKVDMLFKLVSENNSDFFNRRTEMYASTKDLFYGGGRGSLFCPSTNTRRAEDNECFVVLDKREVDPEELKEGAFDGEYITGVYGRYISDDTPAATPHPRESDICTLKLERFIDRGTGKEDIKLTDLVCATHAFEKLFQYK